MIYNIHYDVCAIILALFSIVFTILKKGVKRIQNKLLLGLFVIVFVGSALDIASAIGDSYIYLFPHLVKDLLNHLYYLVHNTMPFVFFCYIICLIGYNLQMKKYRKIVLISSVPYILGQLIIITNVFHRMVFYYSESGQYLHGMLFGPVYVLCALYVVGGLILLIHQGEQVQPLKKATCYFFMAMGIAAVIIQMIFPHLLIQLFVEAFCFLGTLFTVENDDELYHMATGCYNRSSFMYDQEIQFARGRKFNLIIVKIVNMRFLIASIGLKNVDEILKRYADSVLDNPNASSVYYCENGAFAIMTESEDAEKELIADISRNLEQYKSEEGMMSGVKFQVLSLSIPQDANDLAQILVIIDSEVDESQLASTVDVNSNEEIINYRREIQVEEAIERGLKRGNFEVYFQPIWNAAKNEITCGEALLRLKDKKLGVIEPEEFIPIAERKGYISKLGDYVFEKACSFIKNHDMNEPGLGYICLNISAYQINDENLIDRFCTILNRYQLDGSYFNLEITESSVMNNVNRLRRILGGFADKGFKISLDDYGTGYSNFLYLADMDFKFVKLDKSLLWQSEDNNKAYMVLRDTIRLVHDLGMKVVVEGVETLNQKNMLQALGCDYFQGFYYSKALEDEAFYRYARGFNIR